VSGGFSLALGGDAARTETTRVRTNVDRKISESGVSLIPAYTFKLTEDAALLLALLASRRTAVLRLVDAGGLDGELERKASTVTPGAELAAAWSFYHGLGVELRARYLAPRFDFQDWGKLTRNRTEAAFAVSFAFGGPATRVAP
jgi:hypothetical protein